MDFCLSSTGPSKLIFQYTLVEDTSTLKSNSACEIGYVSMLADPLSVQKSQKSICNFFPQMKILQAPNK